MVNNVFTRKKLKPVYLCLLQDWQW